MAWKDKHRWKPDVKDGENVPPQPKPAPQAAAPAPPAIPQANFVARISILPSLQATYNFTADMLQPLIHELLQKRVNLAPTITVSVEKA